MNLPAKRRQPSRLPKHFPIGATYVIEGRGGENGHLRVFSRYVVLPSGQRINVAGDSPSVSASLVRRNQSKSRGGPCAIRP